MLRGCIPILLLTACFTQEQPAKTNVRPVSGISIPAQLTTTVRAEKVHRGDPVEFRTVEAVLVANGIVMPKNAKLAGRVVGAAPRLAGKPSWLVLLVERGEWKNESVPLHAFIASQINIEQVPLQVAQPADGTTPAISPRRAVRESGRVAVENGVDVSSSTRFPQDSGSAAPPSPGEKPTPLKDLRIVRAEDGVTYLFSVQSNLKLPSGTLFMLRDEPDTRTAGTPTNRKLPPSSSSQPQ
jgi:hypothetical protein